MTRHVLDGYLTDTITIASIADDWRLATASTVIPVTAGAFGMVETEAASHNNFYIAGVIMSDKGAPSPATAARSPLPTAPSSMRAPAKA